MTSRRRCIRCSDPIGACMGFVKAGDVLAALEGKPVTHIREVCGKCVLAITLSDDLGLEALFREIGYMEEAI